MTGPPGSTPLAGFWLGRQILPAAASPAPQVVYSTPTPRPDGRIIYIVKKGDTCISISLLHRISEEQLRPLPDGLTGPGVDYLEGVAALPRGLVLIINLPRLLTADERSSLQDESALSGVPKETA